jgi:hypothetical protein
MTRGNQREIDRARAQARHAGKGKKCDVGSSHLQQRETDAKALELKKMDKAARAAAEKEMDEAKEAFEAQKRAAQEGSELVSKASESKAEPAPAKKKKEDLSFLTELAKGKK